MATTTGGPPQQIVDLQEQIGYHFTDIRFLFEALRAPGCGSTFGHDPQGNDGYRRLAQLGDSVLRMVVVDEGYAQGKDRGKCTHQQGREDAESNPASINMDIEQLLKTLPNCGQRLRIPACLRTNPNHQASPSPKMLGQCIQALFAAVYLDSRRDVDSLRRILYHNEILRGATASVSDQNSEPTMAMET